jgi:inner membrane protein
LDALSHALLGFIAGQALQLDPNLQLLLIISSISLDIDALSIQSPEAAFRTHRGPIHSILAAIAASLLIATGYTTFMGLPLGNLTSIVLICLTGTLSHVFLDVFTTGNITALWPFSRRNLALNLTHFIDPIILAVLIIAALVITYASTGTSAIQLVTGATLAFLTLNFGARYYEKNRAVRIVKGLHDDTTSETLSLPTIRPDRWWTVKKIPFESGYRYEIYRVDPFRKKILDKDIVESPYTNYNGPAEPPIDSPQKAVARSKKDKRISATVDRFALPAVSITHSKEDETWQVFWHDALTYAIKREHRGMLTHIKVDGTITTEARWPRATHPPSSSSLKSS